MNYFYLDKDLVLSVQYLDNKRLVKMVLETAQMLSTAANIHGANTHYRPTHKGHPCTKWVAASQANYLHMIDYFTAICDEYTYRYHGKIHQCNHLLRDFKEYVALLPELPFTNPPQVTPGIVDSDDLVNNYRDYLCSKWSNDKNPQWQKRSIPHFFTNQTKDKTMEEIIVLKQICRDIDMEPRNARIKLRKLASQGKFKHDFKQRWQWSPKEAEKIKSLLSDN